MKKSCNKKIIKEKAVFLIYLILTLTIFIDLPKEASALTTNQNTNKACCEKTKSGDFCVYTDKNQCDNNFKTTNSNCEQTSFCTNVCCVDESGECFGNTPKGICESKSNTKSFSDNSCLSVNECSTGCCVLGGQHVFGSEKSCKNLGDNVFGKNKYNFNDIFKRTQFESECLDLNLAEKEGCCVNDNICSYGKKSSCNGEFKFSTKCAELNECSSCKTNFKKGCKDGNVYTFDSCNNAEDLIEICDYSKGNLCKEEGNNAFCQSLDCSSTTKYEKWDYTGVPREHGESWCIYDGPTGDFTDRPGSRQYRFSCVNREEISEGCRDFRQEICLQGKDEGGFSQASCIRNNIYDSEITIDVSTVPIGFKFWENNDENSEKCSEGITTCTVTYVKKNRFSNYECKGNCHCETQQYIDQANKICKGKGDCGFSYNILEKEGSGGLSVIWTGSTSLGSSPNKLSSNYLEFLKKYDIYGGMAGLNSLLDNLVKKFSTDKGIAKDVLKYGIISYIGSGTIATFAVMGLGAFSGTGFLGALTAGVGAGAGGLGGSATGALAAVAAIGFWVAIVVIVVVVILYTVLGGGNIRRKTVTIDCRPWKAPFGGSDCGRCTSDPLKECSEYRCRSLGTSCKLINEGTERVECIDGNPFDVSSPKLEPINYNNYTIVKERLGYRINEQVESFRLFTFGVKTDEAATCKYELNNSIKYDDMRYDFGDSFFKKEHNLSLFLEGNKGYKYFVRCIDNKGNSNNNDYLINFKTKKGPDLTPPIITGTSVKNNAVLPNLLDKFILDLELNEPSNCKYDRTDKTYDLMNNLSLCDNEVSLVPTNYKCTVPITGIKKGVNNYYFRCRDLSNNTNKQSFVYSLTRSEKLNANVVEPSPVGLVYVNDVTLSVETSGGGDNGNSVCRFSEKDETFERMIEFKVTNSNRHLQSLTNLKKGNYNYFIRCRDSALNEDSKKINFRIVLEGRGNGITYVYKDSSSLYFVLDVSSDCEYNNKDFVFGNGIKMGGENSTIHTAPLDFNNYYIKCKDEEGNNIKGVNVNI